MTCQHDLSSPSIRQHPSVVVGTTAALTTSHLLLLLSLQLHLPPLPQTSTPVFGQRPRPPLYRPRAAGRLPGTRHRGGGGAFWSTLDWRPVTTTTEDVLFLLTRDSSDACTETLKERWSPVSRWTSGRTILGKPVLGVFDLDQLFCFLPLLFPFYLFIYLFWLFWVED